MANSIINTGRTNQLAYNNTLCSVNNKRSGIRHQRKIAHKNLMLVDLFFILIVESYANLQRSCISSIPLLTFFDRILNFILT